jgi:hypothetical protein
MTSAEKMAGAFGVAAFGLGAVALYAVATRRTSVAVAAAAGAGLTWYLGHRAVVDINAARAAMPRTPDKLDDFMQAVLAVDALPW